MLCLCTTGFLSRTATKNISCILILSFPLAWILSAFHSLKFCVPHNEQRAWHSPSILHSDHFSFLITFQQCFQTLKFVLYLLFTTFDTLLFALLINLYRLSLKNFWHLAYSFLLYPMSPLSITDNFTSQVHTFSIAAVSLCSCSNGLYFHATLATSIYWHWALEVLIIFHNLEALIAYNAVLLSTHLFMTNSDCGPHWDIWFLRCLQLILLSANFKSIECYFSYAYM